MRSPRRSPPSAPGGFRTPPGRREKNPAFPRGFPTTRIYKDGISRMWLGLSAFGDVFKTEKDSPGRLVLPMNLSCVEGHCPTAERSEFVRHLKVCQRRILLADRSERLPQSRDVPLPVPQVIDKRPDDLLPID